MRVLLLHCHPLGDSYSAALRDAAAQALRDAGHEVDLCDLYAEGFDPVLSAGERRLYLDESRNREPVHEHVQRLLAAQALVLVFPVWNLGLPALLKGWFDRVFLPGVSFRIGPDGRTEPGLGHLRHVAALCTYGLPRWKVWWLGDAPRAFVQRFLRRVTAGRARVGLPRAVPPRRGRAGGA
jgi:putative NADPH-quinone reductase